MRIWSYDLIKVLPKKQLLAMRYELGDMIKQYPNIKNGLVKFANNYDIAALGNYFCEVLEEIEKRGYNISEKYNNEINEIVWNKTTAYFSNKKKFRLNCTFREDNDRYLKQCLYNLEEKYDRGIISEEEWQPIDKFWKHIIASENDE